MKGNTRSYQSRTGSRVPAAASAQQWPTKPIRFVAPFAPGGGTDFIARIAAQKLTEAVKQQVIVENRPGAGGTLGAEVGAKAPPDGYTFTVIAGSYAVNPEPLQALVRSRQRHHRRHPVLAGAVPDRLHPSLPAKRCKELIAIAKAKPGQLELRLQRPGQHHASCNRAVPATMAGIKTVAHPLQGHGTRGDRHDGRPHAAAMGQRGGRRADGEGRQAERRSASPRCSASRPCPMSRP